MKTRIIFGILLAWLVLSACFEPGPDSDGGVRIPRQFWGDWIALPKNEEAGVLTQIEYDWRR